MWVHYLLIQRRRQIFMTHSLSRIKKWVSFQFQILYPEMGFAESLSFLDAGFVSWAKISFLGDLGFCYCCWIYRKFLYRKAYTILELVFVTMSGGTPVSGGLMRQRHSQGYASSGDDLEDDACSRGPPPPPLHRPKSWTELAENFLWIASAIFILYYGDAHSNFIYILWKDDRIRR